jgi:hypothetical protein
MPTCHTSLSLFKRNLRSISGLQTKLHDSQAARASSKLILTLLIFLILAVGPLSIDRAMAFWQVSGDARNQSGTITLHTGGAELRVDFKGVEPDLPKTAITGQIDKAAQAVTVYYKKFPVASAHIVIVIEPGQHGMLQGTTWGARDGFAAVTRLRIGEHTTQQELDANWVMTHELVHMALASLPDDQHWLEEGIATYVEPIARVQAGQLEPERIWADMVDGMRLGEPEAFDQGLNRTHTWGRTYWGGALFCLVADVRIRKQTNNTFGLQDELRAVVAAGGTIDKDWPIAQVITVADKATGTSVLQDLYSEWSEAPVRVDLPLLWKQLGVRVEGSHAIFDSAAPLSRIRVAITAPQQPKT